MNNLSFGVSICLVLLKAGPRVGKTLNILGGGMEHTSCGFFGLQMAEERGFFLSCLLGTAFARISGDF